MLQEERIQYIMQKAKEVSVIKNKELADEINVSIDTVRRDLKKLESRGVVKLFHGGASFVESDLAISPFMHRDILNVPLKQKVAKNAVSFINDGDIIVMNSGTTNRFIAEELVNLNLDITVITNNLTVSTVLMQNNHITVIVAGGLLDKAEKSMYGHDCEAAFRKYRPDLCFLSINAVSLNEGYTDFRFNEIPIMKIIEENARQTIAVMDSTKFERISKQALFSFNQIDYLVTDDEIDPQIVKQYKERNIQLVY